MPDKDVMLKIKALDEQLGWRAAEELALHGASGAADNLAPALCAALKCLALDWRQLATAYEAAKGKGFKTLYVDPLRHAAAELDKVIKQLDQPRRAPLGQLQPPSTVQNSCDMVMKPHAPHAWTHPDGNVGVLSCPGVPPTSTLGEEIVPLSSAPHLNAGLDEAVHGFTVGPGGTGVTCTAMVERDGAGDQCGRYASHPAHRATVPMTPTASPQGLDALIADSVAQARGKIADERGVVAAGADESPGASPLGDTVAYLRGETDELEGGHPLEPSSVHDMTAEVPPWLPAEFTEPRTATEILETMPVSATIPPAPLLGQMGDAGVGYDHTYVPPGGVPATFDELLTPVPLASLPPHISHSQIGTVGECAAKYRLQRIGRTADRDGGADQPETLHEIPQWANIGGHAFHRFAELAERTVQLGDPDPLATLGYGSTEVAWTDAFTAEIAAEEAASPVPRSRWRASKSGAEGETWWNANGPKMIERYLAARPAEQTAMLPASADPHQLGVLALAIEAERTVDVATRYGPVPYRAVLDRVTVRMNPDRSVTLVIRDYKTGATMPGDYGQLGEYGNVLHMLGVPPHVKIVGTFFNARKGVWTPEVDLGERYPADWFTYVVTTGHAQRLALTQGPTPAHPTTFCGGCPVRWACPVKALGR